MTTAGTLYEVISGILGPPQGRLTLATGTPFMGVNSQPAKTTIFYTPDRGNKLPIFDGVNMVMRTFSELSAVTTDTTKSPAAIGATQIYDWFVWNDAGVLRLSHGPAWTNDTTRSAGTALVMVSGILLNSVSITNGPGAQRGTYVGTTRSNATSTLDWIWGSTAVGGGAAYLWVWNAYNRRWVQTAVSNSTASWTYAGVVREAAGSTTFRAYWVDGLGESSALGQYGCKIVQSSALVAEIYVAVNGGTGTYHSHYGHYNAAGISGHTVVAETYIYPAPGMRWISAHETGSAATITFSGVGASGLSLALEM